MTRTLRTTAKRWLIEICTSIPLPLYVAADESLRVRGEFFPKGLGWVITLLFLCIAAWYWLTGKGAASLIFLFIAAL